jgi:hypothetical protein
VQINNGTALALAGTITNDGTLSLASTTTLTDLVPSGTVILRGGGRVVLSDAGTINRNRVYSNTLGSLLDNVDNTISGAGEIFGNGGRLSLLNAAAGVIDATGTQALEIDNINFTNYGILAADKGTLLVLSNVYGGGEVEISGGGAARFGGTLAANTSFAGVGTLELADPYGGTISGMAANDAVDLDFVPFPAVFVGSPPSVPNASTQWGPNPPTYFLVYQPNASSTGGTLSIEENEPYTVYPSGGGSHLASETIVVASLNLTGSYTANDFTFGSDGHGGTVISTTFATGTSFAWKTAVSGTWQTSSDWTPNGTPGAADDTALSANAAGYTVSDNATTTVHTLTTASKATLSITGGTFTISAGTGAGTNAGSVQVQTGGTLDLEGLFRQAATGHVSAALNATVNLISADMVGGSASIAAGGTLEATDGTVGSTLDSMTVTDKGTLPSTATRSPSSTRP